LKFDQAQKIVISTILKITKNNSQVTVNSNLIGKDSLLDSISLVEVCIQLEDLSDKYNFEFDWTSEFTMSRSRSIFRNVKTLAKEFARQSKL
jgi:acyl carrier protein